MSHTPVSWNLSARRADEKGSQCKGCPAFYSRGEGDPEGCLLKGLHEPNARFTFVIETPGPSSVRTQRCMHPHDDHTRIIKSLVSHMEERLGGRNLLYNIVYLVGTMNRGAPNKEIVTTCWPYLRKKLYDHRTQYVHRNDDEGVHVIVPMGATTSRAFVPGRIAMSDMRGKVYPKKMDGFDWAVMPTLGVSNISVKPGVARVVIDDLVHAYKMSLLEKLPEQRDIEELSEDYVIPQTIEEVKKVCNKIIDYTDPAKEPDPDKWKISVDTETNTLHPFDPTARVIMISFAWDDGKACAITLDHPHAPYDPEEAWFHVRRVLACPKPKIFHNAKFDWKMLHYAADAPVNNIWWDTMLAEHFLDEDKKGFYSLKVVTGKYARAYLGYEEKLKRALKSDERVRQAFDIPKGQTEPDPEKSWKLKGFFPTVNYEPVVETKETEALSVEDRRELFTIEKEYLEAHVEGDSKQKSSRRGMLRRRCKNYDLEMPDYATDFDYESEKGAGFENIPLPILQSYAGADADVTRIICKQQRQEAWTKSQSLGGQLLKDMEYVMKTIHVPATTVLGQMEYEGTRIDQDKISRYEEEIELVEEEYFKKLKLLVCKGDFNPNSNDDLAEVIGSAIPVNEEDLVWTDKGNLSVRKDWLKTMAVKSEYFDTPTGDFFEALLIYRAAQKARGTFLKNLRELSKVDGNIHTSFLLNGTSTGRLSSRGPNLQNIPLWLGRYERDGEIIVPGWNLKELFIPSNDDNVFFQLDIASAEVRVLCAYAQDERLMQALADGLDIHSFIASHIFEPSYEEFIAGKDSDPHIKHLRTAAKRVVFGTLYGAGPYKIASQIYGTLSIDEEEKKEQIKFAEDTINLLFDRFPTIQTYVNGTHREVKKRGQVKTFFNRYRRFKFAANQHNTWKLQYAAQREAVNFKIQSTSSDLVLSQLVEVVENIDNIDGRVSLTVHDSIAGEIRRDKLGKMREFFDYYIEERIREKFDWMPVPFEYDLEIGPSYGELAPYEAYELLGVPEHQWSEKDQKMMKKSMPIFEKAGIVVPHKEVANG